MDTCIQWRQLQVRYKRIPHPLKFPFLHHVFNFSSKDRDVWVIEQHKAIFNLDCTKQLYFCSWWGVKAEMHMQEKYNCMDNISYETWNTWQHLRQLHLSHITF